MEVEGFRWATVGEGASEDALFDADTLADRHVGRGEFQGMEFLHVRAKRIISEVPAASGMPFRYTINAYRGCSHACTYCLAGDTLILMGDGHAQPLADVRKGDIVYGTVREGVYRRFVRTPVLDHWSTIKPAWRVVLEDGTEIVASGDHRFLTERGWEYVTGTDQGRGRRPHLTVGTGLAGPGGVVQTNLEDDSYRRGYLCGMIRGDATIGTYRYERPRGGNMTVHRFRFALADAEPLDRARSYLERFGIETQTFLFAPGCERTRAVTAIRTSKAAAVESIRDIVAWPDTDDDSWHRGFLAGIFDAEGSHSRGVLRISNADDEILERVLAAGRRFDFDVTREPRNANGASAIRLRGGLGERLRFFLLCDPATTRKRDIAGTAVKHRRRRVVGIRPLGIELPLYDITTGTGDFVANGAISHNCFARPTHDYLGLGIGEDFERRIVVKVNAVERLRAELAARRWGGHHIAMGTNTDPYQRCEGKYHLTQGIVRVLREAANPFSILTKSTLVLRDLDLLATAASQTDVRVNLSIGTLDRDVWRLTEPATPPPRARVEAVRRLNEAGVPCGVLIAPILPGLSDDDAGLRAVVEACVAAGAVSISSVSLHLRPGVRDVYLERLARTHPELAEETAMRYRRSYLPKAEQKELTARVRRMVDAARGHVWRPPTRSRFVDGTLAERLREHTGALPEAPAAQAPNATQLSLGL